MTCGLFNYLFHVQSTPKKSLCVSILQIRPINTKEICFPEVVSWDPHPELWGPKTCLLFFPHLIPVTVDTAAWEEIGLEGWLPLWLLGQALQA